jgi:hypothetical protein
MSLLLDMQSDFEQILDDFRTTTTIGGKSVDAVRNSIDRDIIYTELANKSVEYKFTLWYNQADLTAAGVADPAIHDEVIIASITYLVAKRTDDPLLALVALDMVEQYG